MAGRIKKPCSNPRLWMRVVRLERVEELCGEQCSFQPFPRPVVRFAILRWGSGKSHVREKRILGQSLEQDPGETSMAVAAQLVTCGAQCGCRS